VTRTKLAAFARNNAVALLALFVALGGTGYAAATINGKDIKNGTISGKALKKHTLTAKQINKSKLGTVPSATKADSATVAGNANALGGSPAASFLKTGCGKGKVNGYAHIAGGNGSFPSTYTSSAPFIDTTFNCSGQPVQVRRQFMGTFDIKFPGNPGTIGFGNARSCVSTTVTLCFSRTEPDVAVTYITSGADAGAFQVLIQTSGSHNGVDTDVDVLIP
jgi:hypothetical protein